MDGDPIRIWVQSEQRWRGERQWPLERTRWTELFLGGPESGLVGALDTTPGPAGVRSYRYNPSDEAAWVRGEPRLVYRTPPLDADLEVTGPIVLKLWATITAPDTDWLVWLCDEAPEGTRDILTKGWLRASHRALDAGRSLPHRPWHPHTRETVQEVQPGQPTDT